MVWFWVTLDFSDTSSDELEEHNAWESNVGTVLSCAYWCIHGSVGR